MADMTFITAVEIKPRNRSGRIVVVVNGAVEYDGHDEVKAMAVFTRYSRLFLAGLQSTGIAREARKCVP